MRRLLIATSLLCAWPAIAFGASGDVVTGSGSTTGSGTTVESPELAKDRETRIEGLKTAQQKMKKADTQYRDARTTYVKERAEHRKQCRDDLRKANRDTRYPTIESCYHAELHLEREFLAKRRTYIVAIPGISDNARSNVLNRLDLLIDAIDTVIFAIDSNVYQSQESLLQTKNNLLVKYRQPFWSAVSLARGDRAISWIAQLRVDIDAAKAEAAKPEYDTATTCLATEETDLRTILTSPVSADVHISINTRLQNIQLCLLPLRPPATGTGATVGGSGT